MERWWWLVRLCAIVMAASLSMALVITSYHLTKNGWVTAAVFFLGLVAIVAIRDVPIGEDNQENTEE